LNKVEYNNISVVAQIQLIKKYILRYRISYTQGIE